MQKQKIEYYELSDNRIQKIEDSIRYHLTRVIRILMGQQVHKRFRLLKDNEY